MKERERRWKRGVRGRGEEEPMPSGTWPKKGDAADISPPKGKRGK